MVSCLATAWVSGEHGTATTLDYMVPTDIAMVRTGIWQNAVQQPEPHLSIRAIPGAMLWCLTAAQLHHNHTWHLLWTRVMKQQLILDMFSSWHPEQWRGIPVAQGLSKTHAHVSGFNQPLFS